jgi:hypothetical protein
MHMKRLKSIVGAAAATGAALGLLLGVPAWAHDDATLDAQAAPHGGQLRMAGPQHYELVVVRDSATARDNAIAVYVTDHAGTKIATAGATGSVTVLAGKRKATAELKPDGDNGLKGSAVYASTPDLKAVVSITLAGQPAQQARFTPLAKAAPAAAANQHLH